MESTMAAARGDEAPRGVWMATSATPTATAATWGRLKLTDGVLAFNASNSEWQLAVSDIKKASIDPSDRLVVEAVAGDVYYVTILDARMSADSPSQAFKVIQRALKAPAARRE
jgi:hypothetical protein